MSRVVAKIAETIGRIAKFAKSFTEKSRKMTGTKLLRLKSTLLAYHLSVPGDYAKDEAGKENHFQSPGCVKCEPCIRGKVLTIQ